MKLNEIALITYTPEEYIEEIKRLSNYPIAASTREYDAKCKQGYKIPRAKRITGLTYSQAVEKGGMTLKPKTTANANNTKRGKKIKCGDEMIFSKDCVPGNRPDCPICSQAKKAKVKAIPDISIEEAKTLVHNTSRHMNGLDNLYDLSID